MSAMTVVLVVVLASFLASAAEEFTNSYNIYEIPEAIMSNGYAAERHHVVTEDGYILEMHRIPKGINHSKSSGPVVFLMHGLLSSSQSFIANGPNTGMAYNLADAGFDVWMGNARGNKLSHNHTSLNPNDVQDKREFFDFSFEEIGMVDVAAMVDYALRVTGQSQLHYIGHSQGGTVFLVLTSMKREYNKKFKSAHLLAGVGYQEHFPNKNFSQLASSTDMIYQMSVALGQVELYPPSVSYTEGRKVLNSIGSDSCVGAAVYAHICKQMGISELLTHTMGTDSEIKVEIAGASLKQIAHYGQNIRDKSFRRWNFGSSNLAEYGQQTPPIYNLGLITTNVTMHYTVADTLLDERDVLAMAAVIPNAYVRKVARDTFLHEDFVQADDSKELVTNYIIEAILQTEKNAAHRGTESQVLKSCVFLFLMHLLLNQFFVKNTLLSQ